MRRARPFRPRPVESSPGRGSRAPNGARVVAGLDSADRGRRGPKRRSAGAASAAAGLVVMRCSRRTYASSARRKGVDSRKRSRDPRWSRSEPRGRDHPAQRGAATEPERPDILLRPRPALRRKGGGPRRSRCTPRRSGQREDRTTPTDQGLIEALGDPPRRCATTRAGAEKIGQPR